VAHHYVFHCKDCGKPMRLLVETLGNVFEGPSLRLTRADSVGVVCPHCKLVGNYSLFENSPDYNPLDGSDLLPIAGHTVALQWLRCEKEDCKALLPVFAIWSAATTEAEQKADMRTWRWDSLHCPRGHKIEAPRV